MLPNPQRHLTSDEIQTIRGEVMINVTVSQLSRLTAFDDFYFDYGYEDGDARRILCEHGLLDFRGEPTTKWKRNHFFDRILVTASKPGRYPVLYRYEYFLTKRGVHLLDRILKKAGCNQYPYKRRN